MKALRGSFSDLLKCSISISKIASALDNVNWNGGVQVPGKGWFIFGGDKSALDHAQGLASLDGVWELGTSLFQQRIDGGHCTIQV